ncbi:MAG: anthranilate phosphoribosyltransferase [Hyphomonadaceae bacterium]|nr:anthranilate phosphoribosyltransferase [Hyphomonadaceae bacterium]
MTMAEGDFARVLDGAAEHAEVLDFLARSVERMGDPQALAAGARAMRERMIRVCAPEGAIDVCGTGGDGAHTLNISTAVAFVVAGAGVPVAKHGNRAASSRSGAADVLEALGVKLTADAATLERCLHEAGIAFLFAQNHHPALARIAGARREFGKRTIFNLLGPLANPASVKRQLVGVFAPDFVAPIASALRELGCERAWVVHGAGGMDELSAIGRDANHVASLEGESVDLFRPTLASKIDPELVGGDAMANAAELTALLKGAGRQSYRKAVVLNAAAALMVAGKAKAVSDAAPLAIHAIDSGAALRALEGLRTIAGADA